MQPSREIKTIESYHNFTNDSIFVEMKSNYIFEGLFSYPVCTDLHGISQQDSKAKQNTATNGFIVDSSIDLAVLFD
ncbi:hypothetical protein EAF00_006485 [Botryotinia globosa]|nr:hypothetical protein EAF00_006485 [Botryotinia globosa]